MSFSALTGTPLVSVLIANYNYAKYIGEAIESVQTQTYQGYELVICDDGSSDDSCKVIESYAAKDPKIVLIRKNNGGQASALNRAFLESKGDVISILDADDAFESMKLAKVVEAFKESPQAGIAIHDLMVVDGDGRKRYVAHYKQSGYLGPEIPTLRMGLPMPQASGLSFRREVLKEILPLPEDRFRSVADWAVAYVAAYLTNTTRVPEVLARYRIHANNLSGTTSTASRLDSTTVKGILAGMDRVISFVHQFMLTGFGVSVPASHVRNILEHRLLLGLLTKDDQLIASASKDLFVAYTHVRRDYPAFRYFFWQWLSRLPKSLSRCLMLLAFRIYQYERTVLRIWLSLPLGAWIVDISSKDKMNSFELKIAYMVPVFPGISETFIMREIRALLDRGIHVSIFAAKRAHIPREVDVSLCSPYISRLCLYAHPDNLLRHFTSNIKNFLFHPLRYLSTLRIFLGSIFELEPSVFVRLLYHFFCGIGFSDHIRKQNITHIHAHFTTGSNMALAASRFLGVPFSLTAHASGDIFVRPVMLEQKTKFAKFIISVCDYSKKYLDSVTGFKYSNKIHRVYNGIEISEPEGISTTRETTKDFLDTQSSKINIVSVGRLVSCKGFSTLIQVCNRLKERGYGITCEIIGDGPERESLLRLIKQLELERTVSILGYRSLKAVYENLSKADVFVLLSEIHLNGYRDGFPTVILEAMLMGLPVVSTWISGIPEMVIHGETGLLIHERDCLAAANALETLIIDRKLRTDLGNEGRKRALKLFNSAENTSTLIDLFLSKNSRSPLNE